MRCPCSPRVLRPPQISGVFTGRGKVHAETPLAPRALPGAQDHHLHFKDPYVISPVFVFLCQEYFTVDEAHASRYISPPDRFVAKSKFKKELQFEEEKKKPECRRVGNDT